MVEWRSLYIDVFLEKLHVNDAENLYMFELENRTFFE